MDLEPTLKGIIAAVGNLANRESGSQHRLSQGEGESAGLSQELLPWQVQVPEGTVLEAAAGHSLGLVIGLVASPVLFEQQHRHVTEQSRDHHRRLAALKPRHQPSRSLSSSRFNNDRKGMVAVKVLDGAEWGQTSI